MCSVISTFLRLHVARRGPLPMESSGQEHWSGLPFPTPGDHPNPGIELASLMSPVLAGGFLTFSTIDVSICCQINKLNCKKIVGNFLTIYSLMEMERDHKSPADKTPYF